MAHVDFGIIPDGWLHLDYQVYGWPCEEGQTVSICEDGDIVLAWCNQSIGMQTFAGSLRRPLNCIDYTGITILPPASLPRLLEIVLPDQGKEENIPQLTQLIQEAIRNGKYMIIYGI